MATRDHIRNPVEWVWDLLKETTVAAETTFRSVRGGDETRLTAPPQVQRIELADLRDVLARGFSDFGTYRTDVIFLSLIYPLIGLILMYAAFDYRLLPLIFPLASGFALVGPIAAVGLYEMSRRREQGLEASWADAFGVVRSPAFGAILVLGLALVVIFLFWMLAAYGVYELTLGPEPPISIDAFISDVLSTAAGWTMIVLGIGVGFLFAVLVLSISVVSFPLLLDRDVGLYTAVTTSVRAVWANPVPMALWGLIVAGGLVLGSIPFLVGLGIVMPVLGHATWHLYRKLIAH
ncbi:MAG TPA: DUF2189 domain-containing protein [Alphaproteobacteria bacterium]|jgi:uncharacterized membrane protein|nr:DUF2189 domain-containing protein [Alphaproteobacteria bacterium]